MNDENIEIPDSVANKPMYEILRARKIEQEVEISKNQSNTYEILKARFENGLDFG